MKITPFLLMLLPLGSTVTFAYSETDIVDRWKPIVIFAGNGQPRLAIDKLRGINELQSLMVDHSTFDPQSKRFIDELWGSIEDFNLTRFYSILPEQNGEWRELHVQGRRQGDEYCYVDVSRQNANAIERINTLGDSSLLVRAKQIHAPDNRTHYLMGADWHIGWGSYSWQSFRSTVNESVRILSLPEPAPGDVSVAERERLRSIVRGMDSKLGDEDIAIIAPLWAAFPHLWEHFSGMGRVENVLVEKNASLYGLDPARDRIKDVDIIISLDPEKIKRNYPAIASYLDRVDDLLTLTLKLSTPEGQLLKVSFDTTGLTLRISMLVDGDGLVPVDNDRPKPEKTVHFGDTDLHMMAVVDATIDMLGVTTDVTNIRSTLAYHPFGDGVRIDLNLNTLPTVKVQGRALGLIPTGFIDALLPTNIDEIILEFMQVAVKGNDGKGIEASIALQNTPTWGVTHMALNGHVEALDSLLARIGVAIVNQRLIPSEAQGNELITLARTSRKAFDQDLAQYEKIVGSSNVALVSAPR